MRRWELFLKIGKDIFVNVRRSLLVTATLLACAASSAPVLATTVRGTSSASAVWISDTQALPKPIEEVLTNKDRSFIPDLVVIPMGSQVRFPNEDAFYHSIYSTSPADPFDIGFYDTGPGKVVFFPNPGVISVHCHIHASMHATIIVADGPYALVQDGRFELDDVTPGRHALHVWSLALGEHVTLVDVPKSGVVTLDENP